MLSIQLKSLNVIKSFSYELIDTILPHEKVILDKKESLKEYILSMERNITIPSIICCHKTKMIIDGHHRFHTLKDLGFKLIPVLFINYSDNTIRTNIHESLQISKSDLLNNAANNIMFEPKSTKHQILDIDGNWRHIILLSVLSEVKIPLRNDFLMKTEYLIKSYGFNIISKDFERPWGGFLVIDESQAQKFSNQFFKGLDVNTLKIGGELSPKILMVKPNARLSWQYHNRRAEIWQIFKGSVGVIRSDTDHEKEMEIYNEGDQIVLKQGERHRLIGLKDYCMVAEIWQHTDKGNPSDEDDIIRVQDDFGR